MMSISFIYPNSLWLLLLVPLTIALALSGPRRPNPRRFWLGLGLRIFLLALVVLALAGLQLRLPADTLTAVFVIDASDSVPQDQQSRGENIIRQAVEAMPSGDQAAVVVFGQDALVERLASEQPFLQDLTSVPVSTRTDIAGALQLAFALFPDEGAKRLVLLSDGRENLGQAMAQAELAAAHGIELMYVPLSGPQGEAEVLVEVLNAPADVRKGQTFDLTILVQSNAPMNAALRVFADGELIFSEEVSLQTGINRFLVPVEAEETGFRRFQASVVPDADTRLQNNEASAFTVVHGPPRILVAEGQDGETDNLVQALEASGSEVTVVSPQDMPVTLSELAAFEAVVLANVPASALPSGVMEALPVYVHDLGKGLVMTGGENSFGAGGYLRSPLEEALPVYMDVRAKEQMANLALVLAIDKSGSMGKCHCDNPDLNQTYTRAEVGQPKVDIAKEAVMRASSALGPQDYLGVLAFDEKAYWPVEVSQGLDYYSIENAIGSFQASGQTNLVTGVEAAYEALQGIDARRKHVILMTDGWVHEGELYGLAEEMKEQGITLSVIAAGEGSALYLSELAVSGGGVYYPATDILQVPDFFLKETVKAVGEYIIEEPFYPLPSIPGPVLQGLDPAALPPLLGYNGTTPKGTARLDLVTPRGDPLLATWQYGLGRAAVWTSDLKGQWGTYWVEWTDFSRFAGQLVAWTLPAPEVEGLSAQMTLEDSEAVIQMEAFDESGLPRNFLTAEAALIGPDLQSQTLKLEQVGAGKYEARAPVDQPGTYLVRLGVNDDLRSLGQQTLGLVVPYSPEYKASSLDRALLTNISEVTGGGELSEPEQAFVHNIPAADYAKEIWRTLLLIAALLFPLDVAIRRMMVGSEDFRKVVAWVQERMPGRARQTAAGPRALGDLFQARERARTRRSYQPTESPQPSKTPLAQAEKSSSRPEDQPLPTQEKEPASPKKEEASGDTMERLRKAKQRARRE